MVCIEDRIFATFLLYSVVESIDCDVSDKEGLYLGRLVGYSIDSKKDGKLLCVRRESVSSVGTSDKVLSLSRSFE